MNISVPNNALFSSDESRQIDTRTIEEYGFDSFTLMETAALGAAQIIKEKHPEKQKGLFICGKGNNAGDALAVARLLSNRANHKIDLYFPLGKEGLSDDTLKNYALLSELKTHGADIHGVDEVDITTFKTYDYVVDGLFGTGLSRDIEGKPYDFIESLNRSDIPVYSMDIPSGLSADTGKVMGISVKAAETITFGTRKRGLYLEEAHNFTGTIHFIPLQFPPQYLRSHTYLLNRELFNTIPSPKRVARHKYEKGVVHVLAGSEGLTGAAITACRSVWENGAGAVFLYAPKKLLPVYEITLPEIIKVPLGDETDSLYKEKHSEKILAKLHDKPGILLAGPGVGTMKSTQTCLRKVFGSYRGKAIIDADALSLWSELKEIASGEQNDWIFTPHIGEAKTYMNAVFSGDLERLEWASEITKVHNCSIIMKGNPTFFINQMGNRFITGYRTHMFSKAGFGDQLAGAVAAQTVIRDDITEAVLYTLYNAYLGYVHKNTNSAFTPETLL
jgi:NAD(P)H-hydrate epimerase